MFENNIEEENLLDENLDGENEFEENLDRETVHEERVFISGEGTIGATVSYSDKERVSPAVILISGTGETDRDGNLNNFVTNFYKDLAEFFVNAGCVAIRYDKRGLHETEGNYSIAALSDFTNDATAVVDYAKSLDYVDESKVFICGHSEGAMIATIIAEGEEIAGLILIGGAGVSLLDIQLNQNRLMIEEIKKTPGFRGFIMRLQTSQKGIDKNLKRMFKKCASTKKNTIKYGNSKVNAKWIREHGAYTSDDYVNMLRDYSKPVLVITGTADLVMNYKHHDNLSNVFNAEIYTPEDVNHMLREIDDDNSLLSTAQQYMRLAKEPFHTETADKMQEWINNNYLS